MWKIKLVALIMLVFLVPEAYSIGVTPASQSVDFEPGLQKDFEFTIRNTADHNIIAKIELEGDSSNYISLERDKVPVKSKDFERVQLHLELPEDMPPGENKLMFRVSEEPIGSGTFSATTAIRSFIRVRVPYPGEYLQASISAPNVRAGENVLIKVTLRNDGTDMVESPGSVVSVSGVNVSESIPVSFGDIGSKETSKEIVEWNTGNSTVGEYMAEVSIDYKGGTTSAETKFKVGDILLNIFTVDAESVSQGGRAKVGVGVESMWNEPIEGVFSEVRVGEQVVESSTGSVPAWGEKTFTVYLETDNLEVGDYNGTAIVFYMNKSEEKPFVLSVKPSMVELLFSPTGMCVIGVTAGVVVAIFIISRFMKSKRDKPNSRFNNYPK